MKKFTILSNYLFLLMAAAILGLTACGDDPILTNELPPSVTINGDVEVAPEGIITLTISGSKGDADMNLLSIKEDGVTVSLETGLNNPDIGSGDALLAGDNAIAFDFTVELRAPATPGTYTYSATVTDANNKSNEASIDVIVSSTPPTISYMGPNPYEAGFGGNIFRITAAAGSADLSTIAVYDDGGLINATSLKLNDEDFDDNPYSLVGDDVSGFDMAAVVVDFSEAGTYNLTFEVTDALGETASTEVSVVVGTPLNVTYSEKFFFNLAGPAGFNGSFDLDLGESLASSSTDAELQDLGNDANGDWRRQVAAEGDAKLVAPSSSSPELFNYSSVNSAEALIAAFNTGVDVSTGTARIEIGDVFVVENNGDYYIIEFSNITTASNDEDFYTINVKGYQP